MKVLFLIPKNNPPTLEGNYSKPLKEFIEACLNKEPSFVCVFFFFYLGINFSTTTFRCVSHAHLFVSTEANCQRAAEA